MVFLGLFVCSQSRDNLKEDVEDMVIVPKKIYPHLAIN
jgi:hypothetical protein